MMSQGDRSQPSGESPRLAYTVRETAAALGVSIDLIYDLCSKGELRFFLVGRRKLIRADFLNEWIEQRTADHGEQDAAS
jgi:excisionase family DNA binding protein